VKQSLVKAKHSPVLCFATVQVSEFQKAVLLVHEEFSAKGPGAVGVELDEVNHIYIDRYRYRYRYICI